MVATGLNSADIEGAKACHLKKAKTLFLANPTIHQNLLLPLSLTQMASHHHHHPHSSHHSPCTSCCCSCCSSNYHLAPPSPTDPLLQAIATQLLHSQYLKPQHQPSNPHQNQHQPPNPHQNHSSKHPQQTQSLILLHSLLRRVAALESSLRHISTSPPPFSLRDVAARTIQTHFRAFLARRSQTLRHLKHLASIKSNLADLKSSLSDNTQLRRPNALQEKAANLLQKLESIQSGDSMIREGKRAISSDLVRLMEFLDRMAAKRQEVPSRPRKKVTFSEIGNRSRAFTDAQEPFPSVEAARNGTSVDHRVSYDDQSDLVDDLSREIERIEGLSRVIENDEQGLDVELEGFQQISDDERDPTENSRGGSIYGIGGFPPGQNENLGLSAPLPVQMEEIRGSDLGKKKKVARVVG